MTPSAVEDTRFELQQRQRTHRLEHKLGLGFTIMAIVISALLTFVLYGITVDWLREGLRQRINPLSPLSDPSNGTPQAPHLKSKFLAAGFVQHSGITIFSRMSPLSSGTQYEEPKSDFPTFWLGNLNNSIDEFKYSSIKAVI